MPRSCASDLSVQARALCLSLLSNFGSARHTVAKSLAHISNTVLPGRCLICGDAARAALCQACAQQFWTAEAAIQRCYQCGMRVPTGTAATSATDPSAGVCTLKCGHCRAHAPTFDQTIALADYRPPLDILAIYLKFRGRSAIAEDFAQRLAALMRTPMATQRYPWPELLIPAPLSTKRLAARGYNQAWEVTRRIGTALGLATHPTLLLREHTAAQSGLNVRARQRAIFSAYAVPPHARRTLIGAHIGVVDDVMTTGATFEAIARALKKAGARRVTNLVVFRTA